MDSRESVDRRAPIATFPYCEKPETPSVRDLDAVTLWKRCACDPENSTAWHEFLSRFIGRIWLFVFRASQWESEKHYPAASQNRAVRRQDPEDLVQEVLLRLVADQCALLKKFEGETEDSVSCYLSVIATSVVIDHYRYSHRQRRLSQDERLDLIGQAVLDRIGISRDDLKMERSILVQEIAQIAEDFLREEVRDAETRERYLLIFKLHLFQGLSLAEISRYCGVNLSKKGVDKVILKIVGRLKERLGRRGEGHG